MNENAYDQRGLLQALIADGRPLLLFTGLCLVLSGAFALFLAATGHFLPHDIHFLDMTAQQLYALHEGRIVHFMIHDRTAFGGSLIAIGSLYMWMAAFPLKYGEEWAWWLFLVTGCTGFGSFLAYLGYGYLDSWHGMATLALLPCFVAGMIRSWSLLPKPAGIRSLLRSSVPASLKTSLGRGRAFLLATAAGMVAGGLTIMVVGMTNVFVPQDLDFMKLKVADLTTINPRLIPLIAHDRAGFGGGICTCGIAIGFCTWCGVPSKSLWQVLCLSGMVGFGTAIGVHPVVGYNDLGHLAPALLGAALFITGMVLCYRPMVSGGRMSGPSTPALVNS